MKKSDVLIPIDFKERNKLLGSQNNEIKPLPVFSNGKINLSCWRMNIFTRIKFLFTGKIYLCVLGKQPPVWLATKEFYNE